MQGGRGSHGEARLFLSRSWLICGDCISHLLNGLLFSTKFLFVWMLAKDLFVGWFERDTDTCTICISLILSTHVELVKTDKWWTNSNEYSYLPAHHINTNGNTNTHVRAQVNYSYYCRIEWYCMIKQNKWHCFKSSEIFYLLMSCVNNVKIRDSCSEISNCRYLSALPLRCWPKHRRETPGNGL